MTIVKNGGENATGRGKIDVTHEAKDVLKTMVLLERSFGVSYLARVLRGDTFGGWKHETHSTLETAGCMMLRGREWVKSLIHHLVDLGYIEAREPFCSTVSITEKGKEFIDHPQPVEIYPSELRFSRFDYALSYKLKSLRKQISQSENKLYYMVFSDYAIDRLIRMKPSGYEELKQVPGITVAKADAYGAAIFNLVREAEEAWEEERVEYMHKKFRNSPAWQQTLKLFEEGKSIEEIAEIREVKPRTVLGYLMRFHRYGLVDLKPWIEENVDSKALYKGAEYFRQVEQPSFRDANATLGIDFDTLRLCKVYVSDVKVTEPLAMQA